MPDRYADAVRARRAELRAQQALLDGGHRTALRSCLALSRLAAAGEAASAFGELGREARAHVEVVDRAGRERLPDLLTAAVRALVADVHARWAATLRPGLSRIATERSLAVGSGWPRLPAPRPPAPSFRPGPAARSVLAGAVDGVALWRLLLLPVAGLPLLGLPALGGRAAAPLAVGVGVVAVVVAIAARRTAVDRARLGRSVDDGLAAARLGLDADIGRWLLELERTAGAELDAAVAGRRAEVDAELRVLAADRPSAVRDG